MNLWVKWKLIFELNWNVSSSEWKQHFSLKVNYFRRLERQKSWLVNLCSFDIFEPSYLNIWKMYRLLGLDTKFSCFGWVYHIPVSHMRILVQICCIMENFDSMLYLLFWIDLLFGKFEFTALFSEVNATNFCWRKWTRMQYCEYWRAHTTAHYEVSAYADEFVFSVLNSCTLTRICIRVQLKKKKFIKMEKKWNVNASKNKNAEMFRFSSSLYICCSTV